MRLEDFSVGVCVSVCSCLCHISGNVLIKWLLYSDLLVCYLQVVSVSVLAPNRSLSLSLLLHHYE